MLWSLTLSICLWTFANTVPTAMACKKGNCPHDIRIGIPYKMALQVMRHHEIHNRKSDINRKGYVARKRRKRAGKIIGYSVFVGLRAVKELLRGTKQVPSHSMFLKSYEKPGDYSRALKDFDLVNPSRVEEFELPGLVKGKNGIVGDRHILLESNGELGRPQIDIYHRMGTEYERVTRITYTN